MPQIRIESEITIDNLINAIKQLNKTELGKLTSQVLEIQSKRRAASFSKKESDLMLKINNGLPKHIQARFDKLVDKRKDEKLTLKEQNELIRITNKIEKNDAERINYLRQIVSCCSPGFTRYISNNQRS